MKRVDITLIARNSLSEAYNTHLHHLLKILCENLLSKLKHQYTTVITIVPTTFSSFAFIWHCLPELDLNLHLFAFVTIIKLFSWSHFCKYFDFSNPCRKWLAFYFTTKLKSLFNFFIFILTSKMGQYHSMDVSGGSKGGSMGSMEPPFCENTVQLKVSSVEV